MGWSVSRTVLAALLSLAATHTAQAGEWLQFRGPQGSGLATPTDKLPTEIGPDTNVVWKTALPPGHSSPVIHGDRIYLTTVKDAKLFTVGLKRSTGEILWEAEAPYEKLEVIHDIGSHAQPSPVTDGERVVSFFGSSGMYCYDADGKLLWKKSFGPFKNDFGAGSSPVISGDRVILCQDHDTDSFLMSIDKRSGETIWKTDRSEFPRNYCTPLIHNVEGGRKQIVVAATLRVVGYDFDTGEEVWTVRGISRAVNASPVVGDGGMIYVAGWAAGGDENEPIRVEPFDTIIGTQDANKNGTLEEGELVDGHAIKRRFTQVDRDKDGVIVRAEYEYFRKLFETGRNLVLAIKPGGRGDITKTHVLWEYPKLVPFCATPLYHNGLLFTIKDGGILSCLNVSNGKPTKQGRLQASGNYYSSPVAGDGKLYLLDQRGKLTVLSATAEWQTLSTTDFGEDAYATPALVDGKIYLRTVGHLYCFGLPESQR